VDFLKRLRNECAVHSGQILEHQAVQGGEQGTRDDWHVLRHTGGAEPVGQGVDIVLVEGADRVRELGAAPRLKDHLVLEDLQFRFGQQQFQEGRGEGLPRGRRLAQVGSVDRLV
jgi:hypothetical protein